MKLARKLSFAIVLVVIAIQVTTAFQRLTRDRRAIQADVRRDHDTLGRMLQAVVPRVWLEDGEARALSVVSAANEGEDNITVRWVWPDAASGKSDIANAEFAPRVRKLGRLPSRESISVVRPDHRGGEILYSYVPARLHDGRLGAIELAESLGSEREQISATVTRTAVQTTITVLVTAIVTGLLGVWLVGRPVAQLMDKARRVGAGDLTGPLHFSQRDELADLATEMNRMCERLDAESSARLHALEQLRHADRLSTVGQLAAGVAHELGTPLNVVSLAAKRISSGRALGEDAKTCSATIVEQTERMSRIIRQLLDFARRRPLKVAPLRLAELCDETTTLLSPLATGKNVQITQLNQDGAEAMVDRNQLQQALANLVMNAIQAMPGGGELRIESGIDEQSPPSAFVRVIDRGTGIDPRHLHRVFEPFFTTKEVGQGTGLGLSVAHGIVAEHGGSIEVASALDEGSRFTVRLPLARST